MGGPRGGWPAAGCPHERWWGSAAGGARDACRASVAGGVPPGALGAGVRGPGRPASPHPTLMRSPVVKGHTTPESGLFDFLPLWLRISVVSPWQRVLSSLPSGVHQGGGPTHVLRVARRAADAGSDRLGESLRPRPVSVPAYRPLPSRGSTVVVARESQARERGRPRQPVATSAGGAGARAGGQATRRAQGERPRCASACNHARQQPVPSTPRRRIRASSREARGSPAPLPEP